MKKLSFLFFVFFVSANSVTAQAKVDSLLKVIRSSASDSEAIVRYKQLFALLRNEDPDGAIRIQQEAIKFCINKQRLFYLPAMYADYAAVEAEYGHFDDALRRIDSALMYPVKDSADLYYPLSVRANIFLSTGKYELAYKENLKILKILNENSQVQHLLFIYNNIILTLNNSGRFEEALVYCRKEYELAEKLNNETEVAWACVNFFETYEQMNDGMDKAKPYAIKLYEIAHRLKDKGLMAAGAQHMGTLKLSEKDFKGAIQFYKEAVTANEALDEISYCNSINSLANAYLELNQPGEAEKYLMQSLQLSFLINARQQRNDAYSLLAKSARLSNDYKSAYEYSVKFRKLSDSLLNEKSLQHIQELEARYQSERKTKELEIKSLKLEEQQTIISRQAWIRNLLLVISALVAFISFLFFNRYRHLQQRRQSEERERISRDLHDHVGSSLGSIANFSEMAKMSTSHFSGIEQNDLLEKIETTSRETIENMSDIVWAINPLNDNMEKVLSRMENFAADLLGNKNISYTFDTDENIRGMKMEMTQRKNVFLIFKEALYNAVKYSGCNSIQMHILSGGNKFHLKIEDNGKGFDPQNIQTKNGNGIPNMKARAKETNGEIEISSVINQGTKIHLQVPL